MQQKEFSIVNRNAPEPDKQIRALSHLTVPQWWRHSAIREHGATQAIEQCFDDVIFHYRLAPGELEYIVQGILQRRQYDGGGDE